jgi:alkanesulfonate monooxygenase SsuD/methylene tetrahydromethanopterin reductase-like flavin-dependent oxidoreductase (luciferase family)
MCGRASIGTVVLSAERTQNIRLTSAVTVLSSDDPVRVFQDFATLDLLSGGRAEIMASRGSFFESFPLFGYDLNDYDELRVGARHVVGQTPPAARRRRRLPAPGPGPAAGLDRRRRDPSVGGARRAARPALPRAPILRGELPEDDRPRDAVEATFAATIQDAATGS